MSSTKDLFVHESGVDFGPFVAEKFFYMEKSDVYQGLGEGFSTVEFMCMDSKGNCLFVEAKSSSPRPDKEDTTDFNKFIEEISAKFQDSYQLFLTNLMERRVSSDIGQEIVKQNMASVRIKFVLVIPTHKTGWLPPLNEALKKQLRKTIHMWNIDVAVMNEDMAKDYDLIA